MEKILALALESNMGNITVASLLRVAAATPNKEIAVMMLLGLYEEPKVKLYVPASDKEFQPKELVSIDHFRQTVDFKRFNEVQVDRWFKSQEDADKCDTVEQSKNKIDSNSYKYDKYQFVRNYGTKIEASTSNMSIDAWINLGVDSKEI